MEIPASASFFARLRCRGFVRALLGQLGSSVPSVRLGHEIWISARGVAIKDRLARRTARPGVGEVASGSILSHTRHRAQRLRGAVELSSSAHTPPLGIRITSDPRATDTGTKMSFTRRNESARLGQTLSPTTPVSCLHSPFYAGLSPLAVGVSMTAHRVHGGFYFLSSWHVEPWRNSMHSRPSRLC